MHDCTTLAAPAASLCVQLLKDGGLKDIVGVPTSIRTYEQAKSEGQGWEGAGWLRDLRSLQAPASPAPGAGLQHRIAQHRRQARCRHGVVHTCCASVRA